MPAFLLSALPWVKRFWWAIPIAGLVIALLITRHTLSGRTEALEACKTNHAQFVADVVARTDEARRLDAAHKATVEAQQDKVTSDAEPKIRSRVAADVASVRDYAKNHSGGGRAADLPRSSESPGVPDGASQTAIVPAADLETCAINTNKAQGWQDWWKGQQAIPH